MPKGSPRGLPFCLVSQLNALFRLIIRNRFIERPGAVVTGEGVGAYAADLVAGTLPARHGETIHLVIGEARTPSKR
jgi:hypothetical protein